MSLVDASEAVGRVQFWGNTPAFDILEETSNLLPDTYNKNDGKVEFEKKEEGSKLQPQEAVSSSTSCLAAAEEKKEQRAEHHCLPPRNCRRQKILLVGAADIRHVIATAAARTKHISKRPLHFSGSPSSSSLPTLSALPSSSTSFSSPPCSTSYSSSPSCSSCSPCELPSGCFLAHEDSSTENVKMQAVEQRNDADSDELHFYLFESSLEVLARHLLFLDLLTDHSLSILERVDLFLDLYGNTLLRDRSAAFLTQRIRKLVDFVCFDESEASTVTSPPLLSRLVDLSHLKYRERDLLKDIIESWGLGITEGKHQYRNNNNNTNPPSCFQIEELRDHRLRHLYGKRYDQRQNLLDWDYQMNLLPLISQIPWSQYKQFGMTGVAFETRLASNTHPNKTLASYALATDHRRQQTVKVRGYWGDLINGPFFPFGVEINNCCSLTQRDRERIFLRVNNNIPRHNATEISHVHLTALLFQLQTLRPYLLAPELPEESEYPYPSPVDALLNNSAERDGDNTRGKNSERDAAPQQKPREEEETGNREDGTEELQDDKTTTESQGKVLQSEKLLKGLENVKVTFLTGDPKRLLAKAHFQNKFHAIFVGNVATASFLPLNHFLHNRCQEPTCDTGTGSYQNIQNSMTASNKNNDKSDTKILPPEQQHESDGKVSVECNYLHCHGKNECNKTPNMFTETTPSLLDHLAAKDGCVLSVESLKYMIHLKSWGKLRYRHAIRNTVHSSSSFRLVNAKLAVPDVTFPETAEEERKTENTIQKLEAAAGSILSFATPNCVHTTAIIIT